MRPVLIICLALLLAGPLRAQDSEIAGLTRQVEKTERAFAQTMADRDFEAFKEFLSPEAVFFSGSTPLRGREAVAAKWQPYFEKTDAPFSWEPKIVEVLESGTLALSSGPVYDPGGTCIGTYNSIWRRDGGGAWKIVFDKGGVSCD